MTKLHLESVKYISSRANNKVTNIFYPVVKTKKTVSSYQVLS